MDELPQLLLNDAQRTHHQAATTTGIARQLLSFVAPAVASTTDVRGHSVAFAGQADSLADARKRCVRRAASLLAANEKTLLARVVNEVGWSNRSDRTAIELVSRSVRSREAAVRPMLGLMVMTKGHLPKRPQLATSTSCCPFSFPSSDDGGFSLISRFSLN